MAAALRRDRSVHLPDQAVGHTAVMKRGLRRHGKDPLAHMAGGRHIEITVQLVRQFDKRPAPRTTQWHLAASFAGETAGCAVISSNDALGLAKKSLAPDRVWLIGARGPASGGIRPRPGPVSDRRAISSPRQPSLPLFSHLYSWWRLSWWRLLA